MKIDVIETIYGDFIIEYSKFSRGFFISSYPEIFKEKPSIDIKTGRGNHYKNIDDLLKVIDESVKSFKSDYKFKRKVICYRMVTDSYLNFEYMVCNESELMYLHQGEKLAEYYVEETNMPKKLHES